MSSKELKIHYPPDFSMYSDLPLAIQIYNTFRRRWCGAFWQEQGLNVIPSVCWGTSESYDFCFEGIEKGSIVAVLSFGNTEG